MAWMHLLPSTSCVTQVAGHSDYFRKHLVLAAFGGGEGGIRTPDTVTRMPHFECGAFNHSATSPWPQGANILSVGGYVSNARRLNKNGLSPMQRLIMSPRGRQKNLATSVA